MSLNAFFRRKPMPHVSERAGAAASAPPEHGKAGELWIDRPDAPERLGGSGLPDQTAADVRTFIDRGYLIVPGAVPHELADEVIADAHAVFDSPEHYVVRDKGAYADPARMGAFQLGHRIIDLYAVSEAARKAVFTPRVSALLQAVFGEPAVAIQSLYFEYGSQQAIHQDTAYVVSRKPLALAAIWIALEDVQAGSGELIFYPGGHRLPHHFFGGERKHWNQAVDGTEAHQLYLKSLHEKARQRGLDQERFLARKGDVLIWHADLPHGGARIETMRTRRSFVLHFAPQSVKANYCERIGADYFELPASHGNFFSCRHYRLDRIDANGRAELLFDDGVSEKRQAERRV